jgi:hypothetical protein
MQKAPATALFALRSEGDELRDDRGRRSAQCIRKCMVHVPMPCLVSADGNHDVAQPRIGREIPVFDCDGGRDRPLVSLWWTWCLS